MPRQEEVIFNEAKENFEASYREIEEAIRAYESVWYSRDEKTYGITKEEYQRLREFSQNIKSDNN